MLTQTELNDIHFTEIVPGIFAAMKSAEPGKTVLASAEFVFAAKDVSPEFVNLLSASATMFQCLALIQNRLDMLNDFFEVAERQAPQLRNDPTMKALRESMHLMEKICSTGQVCATVGVKKQVDTIIAESNSRKK